MKKLALFDMDGTLFDTDRVNFLSYRAAAREIGYEIEEEIFMREFAGKNYKDFLPVFGIIEAEDLQYVHEEKKRLYPLFLSEARVNTFLVDIIKSMPMDYVKALVTTASQKNAEEILTAFHLSDMFEFMISKEDVVHLKPNPEAYLMAITKAGVSAENTIIFEDSDVGLEAAYAAGTAIVQIRRF